MNAQHCRAAHRSAAGRSVGVAALAAVLSLGAASAQEEFDVEITSAVLELDEAVELRRSEDGVLLNLEEAVTIGLRRNLGLQVERYNIAEAGYNIGFNRGIFDTTLTALLATSSETSPAATNLAGADVSESETAQWDVGVSQLVPSGGVLAATWNNLRSETNSQFALLNPGFQVDFDLSFSQPLLRDFGVGTTTRLIRIAETGLGISRETFEAQVTGLVRQVVEAYWVLVEAIEQALVAEESLALAEQLHGQNEIRVDVGTLAPLELVQSEAGVATRQEELIRARALIGDREDVLRQLLNVPSGDYWTTRIIPDTPVEMEAVPIDVEADLPVALVERPELRAQRLNLGNLEIDTDFYQNQTLPRLDVSVTYGLNGLGGDVIQRDFLTGEIIFEAPGDYGDALDQIADADFEGWAAALNLAYPIQNRTARNRLAIADVSLERARTALLDTELAVTTDVRRLARAVETAAQVIASATVSERLERRNLEAEQKRYENGMSTSFQILEIQEDLIAASSRLVNAKSAYRIALAAYYQAVGTLLERAGVEIAG